MEEKGSSPSSENTEPGLPALHSSPGGPVLYSQSRFPPPPPRSFVSKLWPARWLLMAIMLGCTLLALMPGSVQAPLYKIQTSIDLQNPASSYPRSKATSDGFSPQVEYIQTQIRIIQSRSLMDRILAKLSETERSRIVVAPRFSWKRPSYEQGVESILKRLSVHVTEQAGVIDICFLSPDSEAGAHFLNSLTDELADYNVERAWRAAQRKRVWNERQLEELRRKWEQSEVAVLEYSQSAGFTAAPRVRRPLAQQVGPTTPRTTEANDAKLSRLKIHLADLNKQIVRWQSLYGASAPAVAALKSEAAATEISIRQRRAALHVAAPEMNAPVAAAPAGPAAESRTQAMAHLNALRHDADSNRQIYEANTTRLREAAISDASPIGDISVVDPAIAVTKPDRPRQVRNGWIGALSGLLIGLFVIGFRDHFSHTFSEAGLLRQYLKLDVLGSVPPNQFTPESGFTKPAEKLALNLSFDKDARTAEAYRALRSSILLRAGQPGRPMQLVFTSAGEAEGKTDVVGNLGAALASAHRKVLLVDGDLRKPALHELFGATNEHGLSDLLTRQLSASSGTVKMSDVIRQTQLPGLYLLTAGEAGAQAPEILSSAELPELLQKIGKGFDYVLMDSPPVLPFADARSLARAADAVVLVVRAGSTSRRAALVARDAIAQDGSAIAGAVLTDWDARQSLFT